MAEGAQLCTTGNLLISLSVYICRCVLQNCPPISAVGARGSQLSRMESCCSPYLGSACRCRCCLMYQRKWCWGRNRGAHKARSCQHCESKTGNHSCSVLLTCCLSQTTTAKMMASAFWSDPLWMCSSRCFRGSSLMVRLLFSISSGLWEELYTIGYFWTFDFWKF